MELIQKIKSIFNTAEVVELKKNVEFGFTINWIKATKENPHHIIFTSGLSDNKQTVSDKYPEFENIELYFCLPEYWKVQDRSADYNWPIAWLNKIAQLPQKNKTWFGPGDTIPAGNPKEKISSKLKQNNFILSDPILFENQLLNVNLDSKNVRFLSIIPIFEHEMSFKTRNSAKMLMTKYQFSNYNEEVDEYRTSIVKFKKVSPFWIVIILLSIAVGITAFFRVYNSDDSILQKQNTTEIQDTLK